MTRRRITILAVGASLALNVALLLVAFSGRKITGDDPMQRPLRTAVATSGIRGAVLSAAEGFEGAAPKTIWEALESDDAGDFMARLRAVGCPEQTIRDLIVFRISAEYHRRLLAFEDAHFANVKFWEGQDPNYFLARLRLHTQLEKERDTALEELFGGDADSMLRQMAGWHEMGTWREFLPEHKRKALAELETEFRLLENEVRYGRGVYMMTADGDPVATRELERLKQEKRAEIERLLSASELQELEFREGPAADYVRQNSPEVKSEEEFRKLVKAVQESGLVQKRAPEGMRDRYMMGDSEEIKEQQRQENEREEVLQERIKEVVGAERVDEMHREAFEVEWEEGREQFRSQLMELGEGLNIDSAAMDRVMEQIKPILVDLRMQQRGSVSDQERARLDESAKAQVEGKVLEIMGEAGAAFVERWNRKMEEGNKR